MRGDTQGKPSMCMRESSINDKGVVEWLAEKCDISAFPQTKRVRLRVRHCAAPGFNARDAPIYRQIIGMTANLAFKKHNQNRFDCIFTADCGIAIFVTFYL